MKNPILSQKKIPSNSSLCLAGDKGVAALKGDKPPRSSLGDSNYGPSIHGTPGSDFTTVLIVLEQSFLYPTLGGSSRNHGKRWCFFLHDFVKWKILRKKFGHTIKKKATLQGDIIPGLVISALDQSSKKLQSIPCLS